MQIVLPFYLFCVMATIEPVSCEFSCEPPSVGLNGSAEVALLRISTWEQWSFDYPQWNDPTFSSFTFQTIKKQDGVVRVLNYNKYTAVRFYGGQLCLAVRIDTKREFDVTNVVRNVSCQILCLNNFENVNVTILNSTGLQVIDNTVRCCRWARRIINRISVRWFPHFPKCVTCNGCSQNDAATTYCDEGDKCFTVKLQEKKSSNVKILKGCSSMLHNVSYGLSCEYKCKNNVELFGNHGNRYHSVCVSCCSGDSCNLRHDEGTNKNSARLVRVYLTSIIGLGVLWSFAI